jgi:hypothetical protein
MKLSLAGGILSWDASWPRLPEQWKLVELKIDEPDDFDKYSLDQLKWNAKSYEGIEPISIPRKLRKEYDGYVEHHKKFYGCCGVGEIVELIRLEGNAVLLTKKWDGQEKRKGHSDLELWLRLNVSVLKKSFSCEVYSFGTVFVPRGGMEESRSRKSAQDDKWNFCLKAAIIAVNRRNHEQTTSPEPLTGLQGEGGAGRHQGRPNHRPTGGAFRRPSQSDYGLEIAA